MPRSAVFSAKATGPRPLRVGEEVRHALSHLMERGVLNDPSLAGQSITITEVRVSPDLRNATVFVVPLGGGDPRPLLEGLRHARGFLRHELAGMVRMRSVPDLSFEADTSFDEADHIHSLLNREDVQRDLSDDEPQA